MTILKKWATALTLGAAFLALPTLSADARTTPLTAKTATKKVAPHAKTSAKKPISKTTRKVAPKTSAKKTLAKTVKKPATAKAKTTK